MRRLMNHVSLVLVALALAVVTTNWFSAVRAQGMGSFALYEEWTLDLEGWTVGYGSGYDLGGGTCMHTNYELTTAIGSPSRYLSIMEYGYQSAAGLYWEQEEGWWYVATTLHMHCSCGGSYVGGNSSEWFDMYIPVAPDPAKLKQCLDVCNQSRLQIENFCRSLPDPRLRALCWAARFSVVACQGFCYLIWGD